MMNIRLLLRICNDHTKWSANVHKATSTTNPLDSMATQRHKTVLLPSIASHGLKYGGRMAMTSKDAAAQATDTQAMIRAGLECPSCWATCLMKNADAALDKPMGIM